MSDDLVKRLRNTPNWKREEYGDYKSAMVHYDRAPFEAADRIEELEDTLSLRTNLHGEATYLIHRLEAELAKVMEALQSMPEAVVHTTLDDGPQWPEDRTGVWLAAINACKNVVQSKVDQTLAELKGQNDE